MSQLTLVSVDLDAPSLYHAVHGVPMRGSADVEPMCISLRRMLDTLGETQTLATIFVVGKDLEDERDSKGTLRSLLQEAVEHGHELGNHSYQHAYNLVDLPRSQIARDLRRCDHMLRELTPQVEGFRAPGYTCTRGLLAEVAALGYRYDSSKMPAPLYVAAKHVVMAAKRLRGRKSASYGGHFRSFLGSDRPHLIPEFGLWEVPISVTPTLRLPMVGSFLLGARRSVASSLMTSFLSEPYVHLELHALDLVDPENDGIEPALSLCESSWGIASTQRQQTLRELLDKRGGGSTISSVLANMT